MNQSLHPTPTIPRALRLLFVCAILLLMVIFTLINDASNQQWTLAIHATQQAEEFCGMNKQTLKALPDALQNNLRAQCVLAEPELQ